MKFLASWGKGEAKRFSFFFSESVRSAGGRRLIVNYGGRLAPHFSWKGMKGARLLRNRGHSVQSLRGIIAGSWRIVGHEEQTVPWNPLRADFHWFFAVGTARRCPPSSSSSSFFNAKRVQVSSICSGSRQEGGRRKKALKGNNFDQRFIMRLFSC